MPGVRVVSSRGLPLLPPSSNMPKQPVPAPPVGNRDALPTFQITMTKIVTLTDGVLGTTDLPAATPPPAALTRAQLADLLGDDNPAGTGTGLWGAMDGANTWATCCSVTPHDIPRPCVGLRITLSGLVQPTSFAVPTELPGADYAVRGVLIPVGEDGVTPTGPRIRLTLDGRKWFKVAAGQLPELDPTPSNRPVPAGKALLVFFVTTRKCDHLTIDGESGPLTADSPTCPRFRNFGGQLGTAGICGSRITSSSTCDLSLDYTASGMPAINSVDAVPPVRISARFTDDGAGFAAHAPTVLITDSVGNGGNDVPRSDQERSGRGYLYRALGGTHPIIHATCGGDNVRWWVNGNEANWERRAELMRGCRIAVVAFGTNDAVISPARTAVEIIADLGALFSRLREMGVERVYAAPILPRASSTDGWKTVAGQTETTPGYGVKIAEVNDWLEEEQVGGVIDSFLDWRPLVCAPGDYSKWRTSDVIRTVTVAPGSTIWTINTVETLDALPTHVGHHTLWGSVSRRIGGHQAHALNLSVALPSIPADGTVLEITSPWVDDNVHPTWRAHQAMAEYCTGRPELWAI